MINFLMDPFNYLYSKQVAVEVMGQIKTGAGLVIYNFTGRITGESPLKPVGTCYCVAQDILCNTILPSEGKNAITTTVQMLCTSSEGVFLDVCSKNVVGGYVINILPHILTALAISAIVVGGVVAEHILATCRNAMNLNLNHGHPPEPAPAA